MHRLQTFSAISLITFCLVTGCESPSQTTTKTPDPIVPPGPPTSSTIQGTWSGSTVSQYSSQGGTQYTLKLSAKLTFSGSSWNWLRISSYVPVTTGTSYSEYNEYKGSFTVSAQNVTLTMESSRSASVPFDSSVAWIPFTSPSVSKYPSVLVGDKLHGFGGLTGYGVFSAIGENTGLVGDWVYETYYSGSSKPYTKRLLSFTETGYSTRGLYAALADYSDATPSSPSQGTWSTPSAGELSLSLTKKYSYLIAGKYLVVADKSEIAGYAKD